MKTRNTRINGFSRVQLRELLDEGAQALTDNHLASNPRRADPRHGKTEYAMNHLMALLVRDLEH